MTITGQSQAKNIATFSVDIISTLVYRKSSSIGNRSRNRNSTICNLSLHHSEELRTPLHDTSQCSQISDSLEKTEVI